MKTHCKDCGAAMIEGVMSSKGGFMADSQAFQCPGCGLLWLTVTSLWRVEKPYCFQPTAYDLLNKGRGGRKYQLSSYGFAHLVDENGVTTKCEDNKPRTRKAIMDGHGNVQKWIEEP